MRYGRWFVCGLACAAVVDSVSAATLIEQTDGESRSLMYVEGVKLRTDDAGGEGYGLIDLGEKTFHLVNPQEKTVLDMSSMVWRAAAEGQSGGAAKVDARLEKIGSGPEIAGYATEHYTLLANGKACQDLYLSRKAFDDSGFAEIWAQVGQALREMNSEPEACDVAEVKALDYEKYGWPLKTVHRASMHAGQFEEILRIEKGVELRPGGFEVPAGYQVVSFEAMMGSMANQMGGAQSWEDDDEGFEDEDYADESYEDEEYVDEEAVEEEPEDLEGRLKGFMDRFKNDD